MHDPLWGPRASRGIEDRAYFIWLRRVGHEFFFINLLTEFENFLKPFGPIRDNVPFDDNGLHLRELGSDALQEIDKIGPHVRIHTEHKSGTRMLHHIGDFKLPIPGGKGYKYATHVKYSLLNVEEFRTVWKENTNAIPFLHPQPFKGHAHLPNGRPELGVSNPLVLKDQCFFIGDVLSQLIHHLSKGQSQEFIVFPCFHISAPE